MGIGPILPGRIPNTLTSSRLQQSLQRTQQLLASLTDQVVTGQKFFLPSESPAAAIRTIVLQSSLERQGQLQVNVNTDESLLSASEAALTTVSDALNIGKSFALAGVGNSSSSSEKDALATEVSSLIKGVVNAANSVFRGRYLFGGSESLAPPFELADSGTVRYKGDQHEIESFVDFDLLLANNVQGANAFGASTAPISKNIDPALTLASNISDLYNGDGVKLGSIVVTVNDGVNPVQTQTVDLTKAETIGDIKTLLENAFVGGPPTLTVAIDPASNNGIRLTPSGGTVAVTDVTGSTTAKDLGIASAAAAVINGGDVNPKVTLLTNLSDLNNGAGIGATVGNGLSIVNGPKNAVVDISTATTVEDLFNLLELANLDLSVGINKAGDGLSIVSNLSGANFSIGENNGTNAAGLGIRTLDGTTLLKDLNLGLGVPVTALDGSGNLLPAPISITRRDGTTTTSVDLKGLNTIQDVINAINAADPGVLTASLNTVGNGISIVDTSGAGPLTVDNSAVSVALGIDGTEPGPVNTVALVGKDVNPQQTNGVLNLLVALETALRNRDDIELGRIGTLFSKESERFNLVRGEIGSRLKVVESIETRLLDLEISTQDALSKEFDTDLAVAITQLTQTQATLQATLQIAAATSQLSLLNFL